MIVIRPDENSCPYVGFSIRIVDIRSADLATTAHSSEAKDASGFAEKDFHLGVDPEYLLAVFSLALDHLWIDGSEIQSNCANVLSP